jgi:hypothetical protein
MKKLSDEHLVVKAETLAREERRITSEVLECLGEIESRMIYAKLGYSSLYDFCTKCLKYSEGSAHRRISAMRLLKTLPGSAEKDTREKIKAGSLSITNLSLMHGFFKMEHSEKKNYTPEEKVSLLASIENQSKLNVEKKLAGIQPKIIPAESKRVITESLIEIRFVERKSHMHFFPLRPENKHQPSMRIKVWIGNRTSDAFCTRWNAYTG